MTAVAYRQVFGMRNALDDFDDYRPPEEALLVGPSDTNIKGEPPKTPTEPGNTGVTAAKDDAVT
jgi:hypothetical protein